MAGPRPMTSRSTDGREALAQALCKNVLNGENIEKARLLAAYAEAAMAALDGMDEATLGEWFGQLTWCRIMQARSNEQEWHDKKARPLARPRCGRADFRRPACIATSRPIRRYAMRLRMTGGLTRSTLGAGLVRRDAQGRWSLSRFRAGTRADWANLRGDAGSDGKRPR